MSLQELITIINNTPYYIMSDSKVKKFLKKDANVENINGLIHIIDELKKDYEKDRNK